MAVKLATGDGGEQIKQGRYCVCILQVDMNTTPNEC